MILHPGQQVERYIVEEVIFSGAHSAVYRVRHKTLESAFALRVSFAADDSTRKLMLRAGSIQSRLEPTNIVNVIDVIELDRGNVGLLMELIQGPTLDLLIHNHKPTLEDAIAVFGGVLSGLHAAHSKGLVHRDLCPSNVLLDIRRHAVFPKIKGFGHARGHGADTRRVSYVDGLKATAYSAPEMMASSESLDEKSDIFSLGAIFYLLLTGEHPFQGKTHYEVLSAVHRGTFEHVHHLAPMVPTPIAEMIVRMLSKERDDRPENCAEVRKCVQRALGEPLARSVKRRSPLALAARSLVGMPSPEPLAIIQDKIGGNHDEAQPTELSTPPARPPESVKAAPETPKAARETPKAINGAPKPPKAAPKPVKAAPKPVKAAPKPVKAAPEPVKAVPETPKVEPVETPATMSVTRSKRRRLFGSKNRATPSTIADSPSPEALKAITALKGTAPKSPEPVAQSANSEQAPIKIAPPALLPIQPPTTRRSRRRRGWASIVSFDTIPEDEAEPVELTELAASPNTEIQKKKTPDATVSTPDTSQPKAPQPDQAQSEQITEVQGPPPADVTSEQHTELAGLADLDYADEPTVEEGYPDQPISPAAPNHQPEVAPFLPPEPDSISAPSMRALGAGAGVLGTLAALALGGAGVLVVAGIIGWVLIPTSPDSQTIPTPPTVHVEVQPEPEPEPVVEEPAIEEPPTDEENVHTGEAEIEPEPEPTPVKKRVRRRATEPEPEPVVEEPEPEPVVEPPPPPPKPSKVQISITGKAKSVEVRGAAGTIRLPGGLLPGAYVIWADFGRGAVLAGKLVVSKNTPITVHCKKPAKSCTATN